MARTSIKLVECLMPRNPVLLVRSDSIDFFYGVPGPSTAEEYRDVETIVVPGDDGDAVEAIRRLGITGAGEGRKLYLSFRSPARSVARVHEFKVVEIYEETGLGDFVVKPVICGLLVFGEKLVLAPPCMPHVLYTILVSLPQGLEGVTVIAAPEGNFGEYIRRLEGFGVEKVVVPECSARRDELRLEFMGARILREGEEITVAGE